MAVATITVVVAMVVTNNRLEGESGLGGWV